MKEPLRGIRFESVEDINNAVFHGLQELQKKGLNGGIPNLPQIWQSVVDHKREYFEGSKKYKLHNVSSDRQKVRWLCWVKDLKSSFLWKKVVNIQTKKGQ